MNMDLEESIFQNRIFSIFIKKNDLFPPWGPRGGSLGSQGGLPRDPRGVPGGPQGPGPQGPGPWGPGPQGPGAQGPSERATARPPFFIKNLFCHPWDPRGVSPWDPRGASRPMGLKDPGPGALGLKDPGPQGPRGPGPQGPGAQGPRPHGGPYMTKHHIMAQDACLRDRNH